MILFSGDDVAITITITDENDAAYAIDVGATVEAALFSDPTLLTSVITCNSGETGADWPNGIVVVPLTSTDTGSLSAGPASVEIQITDNGKTTIQTSSQIEIRQGLIS